MSGAAQLPQPRLVGEQLGGQLWQLLGGAAEVVLARAQRPGVEQALGYERAAIGDRGEDRWPFEVLTRAVVQVQQHARLAQRLQPAVGEQAVELAAALTERLRQDEATAVSPERRRPSGNGALAPVVAGADVQNIDRARVLQSLPAIPAR